MSPADLAAWLEEQAQHYAESAKPYENDLDQQPMRESLEESAANLRTAARYVRAMETVDKIMHGKLDSRPNAPILSVYLDTDGLVCIHDEDYSPHKYWGTGATFYAALEAIEAAGVKP